MAGPDSGPGFAGGALLIGATLGDFLTKLYAKGGLDFGTVGSSAVLGGVLRGMVGMAYWFDRQRSRQQAGLVRIS